MAYDREKLQPGEVRQCKRCGAFIEGALTLGGDVLAVSMAGVRLGRVWVGESESGTRICAELGGDLLNVARTAGFALREFHVHPAGE